MKKYTTLADLTFLKQTVTQTAQFQRGELKETLETSLAVTILF